jgi:hypothetical protein
MTKREKSEAKHMETDASADRAKAIAAAHRIKMLRKDITLGEGLTIRELIDKGRRYRNRIYEKQNPDL